VIKQGVFHGAANDRLLSDLRALQRAVRAVHGSLLIADRVDNALGDFEHQQTIWDAHEGLNRSQGWDLPGDFIPLFESWTAAYRRLADVRPQDPKDLAEAATAAEEASDALLSELYRCKDPRVGRLALALDLFEASEEIVRQNLRRQHPTASPELIERYLDEWLHNRPGAESGDGPVARPRRAS
jgi:hypothetical protein